jgi:hypothetical protein
MLRFFAGLVTGVWLAQNFHLPDVGKEVSLFQQKYIKKKPNDS